MTTVQTATITNAAEITNAIKASKKTAHPCECGQWHVSNDDGDVVLSTECNATTKKKFAMGHDSKLKSLLIFAGTNGFNIASNSDGMRTEFGPMQAAKAYGFEVQVQNGIEKAHRKSVAKAAKKAAKVTTVKAPKAPKVKNMSTPSFLENVIHDTVKAPASVGQQLAPKHVTLKVGRWTYPGTLFIDGTAEYTNKKGETVKASAFTVV